MDELLAWLDANLTPEGAVDPRFPGVRAWSHTGPEQPGVNGMRVARNTMRVVLQKDGRVRAWGIRDGRAAGKGEVTCAASDALTLLTDILEEIKH